MTRPQIVRADTIDLQDLDQPSAADHTKQPSHPAPLGIGPAAPHQQSQVEHVLQERHSAEQALSDAWNGSNSMTDEPGTIDDNPNHANGDQAANGEGQNGEGGEPGSEANDDDMMDRISSSPSIDDGGYTSTTVYSSPPPAWPRRQDSLTPNSTPTRGPLNRSASSTPDSKNSSPFVTTPAHLPLQRVLSRKEKYRPPFSPLQQAVGQESSSPFVDTPQHLPLHIKHTSKTISSLESEHHHLPGEYPGSIQDEGYEDAEDELKEQDERSRSELPLIESPFRNQLFSQNVPRLAPTEALICSDSLNSVASFNSSDLQDVLLPTNDPLLDTPPSPTNSDDSWADTDSNSTIGYSDDEHPRESYLDSTDDDGEDDSLYSDPRFVDSGWGGECLRDSEDIDFEFVYALHTFVATVEGQANATKGDTMVLLDDTNSYWWLVKVVKDSSIGYLPAEHIETPTERLARLNKHRNIDLSATMLGDNPEKSKNPLIKAMRRRKEKTVQFAAPTYVEASDYDYSTEDEEHAMIDPYGAGESQMEDAQNGKKAAEAAVEAATESAAKANGNLVAPREGAVGAATSEQQVYMPAAPSIEEPQLSPKLLDKSEAAPLKSRKGTVRNADSFLKDDTIETRKITLTPGLLREDSTATKSAESTRNNSLESLDKTTSPPESKKDNKPRKERKQGMLSGLFKSKKKDKKSKDDAESDVETISLDIPRNSPRASPMPSGETSPVERPAAQAFPDQRQHQPQARQPTRGKLQKHAPPNTTSLARDPRQVANKFFAELEGSQVAYEAPTGQEDEISDVQRRIDAESAAAAAAGTPAFKAEKPKKTKKAKQHVELDDFDAPTNANSPSPFAEKRKQADRLSESPVEISSTFMHGTESIHIPTPGPDGQVVDLEEEEESEEEEEPESLTSSPSIIEHPSEPLEDSEHDDELMSENDPTPTARSPMPHTTGRGAFSPFSDQSNTPHRTFSVDSAGSTLLTPPSSIPGNEPPWSDANLRAWLDGDNDVRDMLLMIHDKSDLVPVPPDHPLMSGLFVEERKGVQAMMGELDGLLGSFLQRRGARFT